MSARKNLRAVGKDEKPAVKLSVSQAAATGNHRSLWWLCGSGLRRRFLIRIAHLVIWRR